MKFYSCFYKKNKKNRIPSEIPRDIVNIINDYISQIEDYENILKICNKLSKKINKESKNIKKYNIISENVYLNNSFDKDDIYKIILNNIHVNKILYIDGNIIDNYKVKEMIIQYNYSNSRLLVLLK